MTDEEFNLLIERLPKGLTLPQLSKEQLTVVMAGFDGWFAIVRLIINEAVNARNEVKRLRAITDDPKFTIHIDGKELAVALVEEVLRRKEAEHE